MWDTEVSLVPFVVKDTRLGALKRGVSRGA